MELDNHEFSDTIAEFKVDENTDQGNIILNMGSGGWVFFSRDDVKAMAEHFNLILEKQTTVCG